MLSEEEGIRFNSFLHTPSEMGFLCTQIIVMMNIYTQNTL